MDEQIKLRKTKQNDLPSIMNIINDAILSRRNDGSSQWQNGYPNRKIIQEDINRHHAYVLASKDTIFTYGAIIDEIESAYTKIDGNWITNDEYIVVHRLATNQLIKQKGLATMFLKEVEKIAMNKGIFSIKIDTSSDNPAMLRILEKLEYRYCGTVYLSGPRLAFEKVLHK